jgi:hypothetical protein
VSEDGRQRASQAFRFYPVRRDVGYRRNRNLRTWAKRLRGVRGKECHLHGSSRTLTILHAQDVERFLVRQFERLIAGSVLKWLTGTPKLLGAHLGPQCCPRPA